MSAWVETLAITKGETNRSLKSGRVVVLAILFLLFTALALAVVGFFNYQANAQITLSGGDPDQLAQSAGASAQKKQLIGFFFTNDAQLIDAFAAMPLVLLIVFKLAILFLPLFIALMGFDQISGEVGPKSIRYLVVRVRRTSIVFGKFLSQATVLVGLVLLSTLAMVGAAKALNADFGWGAAAMQLVKLVVAGLSLSVAYLGLTSFTSALARHPSVSLAANIIALFFVWALSVGGSFFRLPGETVAANTLASLKPESWAGYVRFLSPWTFGDDLLHPHLPRFLGAAMVHLGWAAVFLALANFSLRRRDL